jgi:uncharacterized protein (DUF1778 family)
MAQIETRKAPINIRALDTQRSLIDRAAAIHNKSRSEFMLEAACREAENTLLDQRLYFLTQKKFKAFEAALSSPITENERITDLLASISPWEK